MSNLIEFGEYQPHLWIVEKDTIYFSIKALESGLEYARECLSLHDRDLGRTTAKNKSWAEHMEKDIKWMEQSLEKLKREPVMEYFGTQKKF